MKNIKGHSVSFAFNNWALSIFFVDFLSLTIFYPNTMSVQPKNLRLGSTQAQINPHIKKSLKHFTITTTKL
jgi:hypothetical protein